MWLATNNNVVTKKIQNMSLQNVLHSLWLPLWMKVVQKEEEEQEDDDEEK